MGESIVEGTIVRWIKKVGDRVDRDEPHRDFPPTKNAELAFGGRSTEIAQRCRDGAGERRGGRIATQRPSGSAQAAAVPAPAAAAPVVAEPEIQASLAGDELRRQKSSPLVRKIAAEHHVNIAQIPGTGLGGRVTKHDILGFLGTGSPAGTASHAPTASAPVEAAPHTPVFKPGDNVELVPMSVMRRKIAEHMVLSRRTSAHVHSVFEIDYTRVAKIRAAKKADYEKLGVKLTFMSFILKATVDALKAVPIVNTSIDGDTIVYKKDINLGVAVALDGADCAA